MALDALLARLAADGLVRAEGKQRTDSTHVVATVAALHRLELAEESVRATVEALAAACPDSLEQRICVSDWARRYGTPMTSWRPPASKAKQDELAIGDARDGYALLGAVYEKSSPAWLREMPAVDVLRRVLLQNYTRVIHAGGREVIRRREKEPDGDGLPPGHARMTLTPGGAPSAGMCGWDRSCTSPRPATIPRPAPAGPPAPRQPAEDGAGTGTEHDKGCARLTAPNLITHVATTDVTVTGNQTTRLIHDDLARKNLAPGRSYTDSGYLSAA